MKSYNEVFLVGFYYIRFEYICAKDLVIVMFCLHEPFIR